MGKKSANRNKQHLWAEASDGGRSLPIPAGITRPVCDCRELLAFLAEHPEADNELIRWYISKQTGKEAT